MKRFFCYLILVLAFFLKINPTFAEVRLSLSPAKANLIIMPGKSSVIYYDLVNQGDPSYVTLEMISLKSATPFGQITLGAKQKNGVDFRLRNNDIILGQEFLLQNGDKKPLGLDITIDQTAQLGDYYFALVAKSAASSPLSGQVNINIQTAVASPIIVSVSRVANPKIRGRLDRITLVGGLKLPFSKTRLLDSFDNAGVRVIVKNTGRYNFTTSGSLIISSPLNTKKSIIIPPQIIAANSSKVVSTQDSFCQNSPDRPICASETTSVLAAPLLGRTTVTAKIALPDSVHSESIAILALPFKLMLLTTMVTIVGIFYLRRTRS